MIISLESVPQFIVRSLHPFGVYSIKRHSFGISNRVFEVSDSITSDNYWSSTSNANNTDNAWNVNFWSGNSNNNNKSNTNYVRCVRGGE